MDPRYSHGWLPGQVPNSQQSGSPDSMLMPQLMQPQTQQQPFQQPFAQQTQPYQSSPQQYQYHQQSVQRPLRPVTLNELVEKYVPQLHRYLFGPNSHLARFSNIGKPIKINNGGVIEDDITIGFLYGQNYSGIIRLSAAPGYLDDGTYLKEFSGQLPNGTLIYLRFEAWCDNANNLQAARTDVNCQSFPYFP